MTGRVATHRRGAGANAAVGLLEVRGIGVHLGGEGRGRFGGVSRGDGLSGAGAVGSREPKSVFGGRFTGVSRGDGLTGAGTVGSRARGYTLIEVLVAFAVLALALTLLLGTLSGAARQVRWSADAGRAALHAQSLLAQVGVGEVLRAGRSDGELEGGRYRWELEVEPYADSELPPPALVDPFAPRMLALQLTVAWGDGEGERLRLRSLRLVQPDLESGVDL